MGKLLMRSRTIGTSFKGEAVHLMDISDLSVAAALSLVAFSFSILVVLVDGCFIRSLTF